MTVFQWWRKSWGSVGLMTAAQSTLLLNRCFCVLFYPQLPGGTQGAGEHVFGRLRQTNVGHSHSSPSAVNGQEDVRQFADKVGLLLRGEHQVAVAFVLRCEGGEDAASHAEVGGSHVRAFFCALEAQSNAAEVGSIHGEFCQGLSTFKSPTLAQRTL